MSMAQYNFYIQKYPIIAEDGTVTTRYSSVDIEATYNAKYKQFKDFLLDGDLKNAYTESFAEASGDNIWVPPEDERAYSSYECTLELLFDKTSCLEDVRKFDNDFRGQEIEYHDTFRNLYVTLLMTKQPKISQELLYGNRTYVLVQFTFSNVRGCAFKTSQIK